jgi:probable Rubsico expression protein CbbX
MWGVTTKHFKTGILLFIPTVGLALAWQYAPHLWFLVGVPVLALLVALAWLSRDSWRQAAKNDPVLERRTVQRSKPARPAPSPRPVPRPAAPARSRSAAVEVRARTRSSAADARAKRRGELLDEDATVTLSAERQASGVDDVFAALDRELVGLVPVKKKVEEIASLLLVDRVRLRFGLSAPRPNLHMCFTGEPGTGKTTVALQMADLLHRLGYLQSPHVVHAMRDDLVGEYIGHTAPKTKRVLERAMGGVLFIDEAYYLYRSSDAKDYGQEAIDILLQVMENDRDKLVVILAGYKDRMDDFFGSNPGMSSRIAHHLDFVPYQIDELVAIGRAMLERASYYLSDEAERAFREYLALRMQQPRFANARSVRNELERARLRHAHRLASDPELSRSMDDLMRIEHADILASPVFALAAAEEAVRQSAFRR